MDKISTQQLYALFLETLNNCGTFLLNCSTQDICYHLFEEFDTDSISFLHENALHTLAEKGYISAEVYSLSKLLGEKFRSLENTELWSVDHVKTSPQWRSVLELSDKIRSKTGDK